MVMVWPGGHGMVYVLAWQGMLWYMLLTGGARNGMACRA